MSLSEFPNKIDSFVLHVDAQYSDLSDLLRIEELQQTSRSISENDELNALIAKYRDKIIRAEDMNKMQNSVQAVQIFFRDNVIGYIEIKQNEFQIFIDKKKQEVIDFITQKETELINKQTETKIYVDNLKSEIQNIQNNATNNIGTIKDDALTMIERKKENIIEYMGSTTAGSIRNDIGIKGELTTKDKTSLIKAINEVNAKEVDFTPVNEKIGILNGQGEIKEKVSKVDFNTFKEITETSLQNIMKEGYATKVSPNSVISLSNSVNGVMELEIAGDSQGLLDGYLEKNENHMIGVTSKSKNLVDTDIYSTDVGLDLNKLLQDGHSYTISTDKARYIKISVGAENGIENTLIVTEEVTKVTFKFNKLNKWKLFVWKDGWTPFKNEKAIIQLEEGDTATSYEPYKEDRLDILLKEPLRGLPSGIRDVRNSNGVTTKKVGKIKLNGTEEWYLQTDANQGWGQFEDSLVFSIPSAKEKYKMGENFDIYSNLQNVNVVDMNKEGITYQFGKGWSYISIRLKKNKFETANLEGFRTWLSKNPVILFYELAIPTIEKNLQLLNLQSYTNGSLIIDTDISLYTTVKYPVSLGGAVSSISNAVNSVENRTQRLEEALLIDTAKIIENENKLNNITSQGAITKITLTNTVPTSISDFAPGEIKLVYK